MEFDPLIWIRLLIATALFIGAYELLLVRWAFDDDGIWRWGDLRDEFRFMPFGLSRIFDLVLDYRSFIFLLRIQLIGALLLPSYFHPALVGALLFTVVATAVRFRGTFNGGSDYMTVVVLSGLLVVAIFPGHAQIVYGAVCYIAVVSVLSYFIAGVVKLRSPSWRQGEALPALIGGGVYGTLTSIDLIRRHKSIALSISWLIIAFECLFPLALLSREICVPMLLLGAAFHLCNAMFLGLNRFMLVWIATYPAILCLL